MSDAKKLAERVWAEWEKGGYPLDAVPGPAARLAREVLRLHGELPDGKARLLRLWDVLGPQERLVLISVADGLVVGHGAYGPLDVADGRDWIGEGLEELRDLIVYLTAEMLRRRADSK